MKREDDYPNPAIKNVIASETKQSRFSKRDCHGRCDLAMTRGATLSAPYYWIWGLNNYEPY